MKHILIGTALLLTLPLTAQQDLATHLLRGVWQANYTNPALLPDEKIVIGLPGLSQDLHITGITYNSLVIEKGDDRVVDINNAINELEADNLIRENFSFETLSLGLRLGQFTLLAGHRLHFNAFANYPKTFAQLVWEGNAQFIGQTVAFGHDYQLGGYNELYLGGAMEVTKGLTLGGRFKFLNGFADISTDRKDLSLFTDDDTYQLTLDADYRVNSTGSLRYEGFRDIEFNYNFGEYEAEDFFTPNRGYAFDFGFRYEFDRFDIAGSVLDLGQINWNEDPTNYSLQGAFEYQGLDIGRQVLEDSTELGSAIDTLLEIYEFVETNNSYATRLAARVYLSATYQLTDSWRLGAVFFTERFRGETFPAFAVSANTRIGRVLEVGGLYAVRNERFDNLGLNMLLRLGPVQLLAATDNLLTAFRPKDANSMNFRVGLNLAFGGKAAGE